MKHSPIVTADQLASLGPIRLLYVPADEERPAGLTAVPIASWIAAAKRSETGFDDLPFWQEQLAGLGIGADATTVVLDDGGMTEAARVWFILQYFGLPAAVLNGGLPELGAPPAEAPPAATPPELRPGAGAVGLIGRRDLKASLDAVQVLDARTEAEFAGTDLKGNARGGHLPGAAHLYHRDLLDGRRLRPVGELAGMMRAAGLGAGAPLVTHCQGGGRAALAALAAHAAGQPDVRVYYLSFGDWAVDESCPLAS